MSFIRKNIFVTLRHQNSWNSVHGEKYSLIFLLPLVYRPLQDSEGFAKRFKLLSKTCFGYIFALSGAWNKNLPIENFLFYSAKEGSTSFSRSLSRLWIQALFPALLLWKRRTRADAIIAYDPYTSGLAGVILKLLSGSKLIVEINGDYHKLDPVGQIKKWLGRTVLLLSVWFSDALKVGNRDQEAYYHRRFPGKRIYRFPDFVATHYFGSLECYRGDYLLSIGHPFDLKGMDILIRAFQLISDRHPIIRLKIMGYCPSNQLQKYKLLSGNNSRIEFLPAGWLKDVAEQMRGCYAFVSASRCEAAARVKFEAMACRKPVVTTKTNSGLDYILDSQTGLLCNIEDVEDLASKLDWLLSNPILATRMGEQGYQRIQQDFSEEHYVSRYLAVLQAVVNRSRHGSNEKRKA